AAGRQRERHGSSHGQRQDLLHDILSFGHSMRRRRPAGGPAPTAGRRGHAKAGLVCQDIFSIIHLHGFFNVKNNETALQKHNKSRKTFVMPSQFPCILHSAAGGVKTLTFYKLFTARRAAGQFTTLTATFGVSGSVARSE